MATTLPGVRPSMSLASRPTATTSLVFLLIATIDGSLTTMPLVLANTSVLAVPKSMARSEESRLNTERRLYPFLLSILNFRAVSGRGSPLPATQFLRNHDRHALDGRTAPTILPGHHNLMTAARERLREITEMAVALNIRHRFPINNERRVGLGAPDQFHHVSMHFRAVHFQQHLLALALADQREFEGVARRALLLMRVNGGDVPIIVAGIEAAQIHAGPRDRLLGRDAREHRIRAHPQAVAYRLRDRQPREVHGSMLWIRFDQRLQVQRRGQTRWRQQRGLA